MPILAAEAEHMTKRHTEVGINEQRETSGACTTAMDCDAHAAGDSSGKKKTYADRPGPLC